jgi:dTDP-4-amino-4,6-dideoxygalactose transaminase
MILFNDFQLRWKETGEDTLSAVRIVGSSGQYILGEEVRQFESALARDWGLSHAVGLASGLDAIEIGLRVLGCKAGDRVLTTPMTAFATTLAIAKIGAIPVFVDCDRYGLIDLKACAAALAADRRIRFFVPVHLYGHSLDLSQLAALRDDFDLMVVEDCAQSTLASHHGYMTGTVGQVAATSFYPTKNLGAIGDGGAILTSDAGIAFRTRILRDYGQTSKYRHVEIGYNSRLDELQAAILLRSHLPRLRAWTERRRFIARRYCSGIRNGRLRVPGSPTGSESCWHLFPVFVAADQKPAFLAHLQARQIAFGEHYPIAVVDQAALLGIPHEIVGTCETARLLCAAEVSLPIHPYITEDGADAVIEACNSWN